jgi:hypothetical protein
MATAAHSTGRRTGRAAPVAGPASAKAGARARPKAKWSFGGDGGGHEAGAAAVQAKMEVSQPEDLLEREADRVADHVMGASPRAGGGKRMGKDEEVGPLVHRAAAPSSDEPSDVAQRVCTDCAEDEDRPSTPAGTVQRRPMEDEPEAPVQRLPQTKEEVAAASSFDDREERPSQVARMASAAPGPEMVEDEEQRKKVHRRADDDDADEKKVHRDAGDGDAVDGASAPAFAETGGDFEDRLRLARLAGGAPLPSPLLDFMEPRLHTDLQGVRVHVDDGAASLARHVHARAFTVGRHIFFAPGQFQPQTQQGQRLVAHELTHVLQQRGGLHSVQREVMDHAADGERLGPADEEPGMGETGLEAPADEEAAPDTIDFARLMRIFNWREGVTPPLVLAIIRELLQQTLRVLPKAEKLLPLVAPARATERTVRRTLRSPSHELRLEASRAADNRGSDTEWELTFLDGTRAPSTGGRTAGGTDEDAIDVPSSRPSAPPQPGADLEGKSGADLAPPPPAGSTSDTSVPRAAPGPEPGGEGAAPEAAGAGAAAEAPIKSPPPEEDPDFQAVNERARAAAEATSAHSGSDAVAANAKDAADVAPSENLGKAQQSQVGNMKRQETPAFNKQVFIDAVLAKVEAVTPKNLKEARDFKPSNKAAQVTGPVRDLTNREADRSRGPLKQATDAPPDVGAVNPRDPAALALEQAGKPPADIQAEKAVPKERAAAAVEDVAQQGQASVDAKMGELGLPDPEQTLATSNEPEMVAALDAKKAVDKDTVEGPAQFRAGEAEILGGARTELGGAAAEGLGQMVGTRGAAIKGVGQGQTKGKAGSEDKRQQVSLQINQIFVRTRGKVQARLTNLEQKVTNLFNTESARAAKTFQDQVAAAEARWENVSFLDKVAQSIDSFLFSMPNELEQDLRAIRASYLREMRNIVETIATLVADELNAAKQDVEDGRAEGEKVIAGLGPELEGFKQELRTQFAGKFNALETDIQATFTKLATKVATRVKESIDSADKLLQEVRDRNKSFIDEAVAAIGNTITTFLELKAKLESAFASAKEAILGILADPQTFARNLFAGIGQGFKSFAKNILTHLKNGVIEWLTGAVSAAGIVIPERLDAAGILSLFLQVIGLTVENVKARARIVWGDKVVDMIEKIVSGVQRGVAAAEKATELFTVLQNEGVAGLVRLLKEKIIALKDQALDQIKNALAIEVVAAAIQNLLSLLTPASALVQAVIKIVNTVLFFIRNASRISELVSTIAGAANDILAGNIAGVAAKVEGALARTIPIVLDFLASLLGIGGRIVTAIKKAIEFVRAPVNEAIDFVLRFIRKLLEPLILGAARALGLGPEEKPPAGAEAQPSAQAAGQAGTPTPPEGAPTPGGPVQIMSNQDIVDEVARLMSQPTTTEDAAQAISEERQKANELKKTFQPRVQDGKTLQIETSDTPERANQDGFIDFNVSINPNAHARPGFGTCGKERKPAASGGGVDVTLVPDSLQTGGEPSDPTGWFPSANRFAGLDRAHVLGRQFGGPGSKNNIVPADADLNQNQMKAYEDQVAAIVDKGWRVKYTVQFSGFGGPLSVTRSQAVDLARRGGFDHPEGIPPFDGTIGVKNFVATKVTLTAKGTKRCNPQAPDFDVPPSRTFTQDVDPAIKATSGVAEEFREDID